MKALKGLVIGMGVLLLVGLMFIGWGLSRNLRGSAQAPASANAVAGEVGSAGYFSAELPVPSGSQLTQVLALGDRVLLRITSPDADRLLILDPRNGQIVGRVSIMPERP